MSALTAGDSRTNKWICWFVEPIIGRGHHAIMREQGLQAKLTLGCCTAPYHPLQGICTVQLPNRYGLSYHTDT